MPKKKNPETPEEQSARFKRDAERLIEAGELNPTVAEDSVDRMIRQNIKLHGA